MKPDPTFFGWNQTQLEQLEQAKAKAKAIERELTRHFAEMARDADDRSLGCDR